MAKRILAIFGLTALLLVAAGPPASAGVDVHLGIGIPVPGVYVPYPPPVVYAPRYYAPPVYYPRYYAPPPFYGSVWFSDRHHGHHRGHGHWRGGRHHRGGHRGRH